MIVCDRDSNECMVHRCSQCPGIEPLKMFLTKALTRNESDDSDADTVVQITVIVRMSRMMTRDNIQPVEQLVQIEQS